MEVFELFTEEDPSRKVDLALADPLYDEQSGRNGVHVACDVLKSNYMEDMTDVLGDVLKP